MIEWVSYKCITDRKSVQINKRRIVYFYCRFFFLFYSIFLFLCVWWILPCRWMWCQTILGERNWENVTGSMGICLHPICTSFTACSPNSHYFFFFDFFFGSYAIGSIWLVFCRSIMFVANYFESSKHWIISSSSLQYTHSIFLLLFFFLHQPQWKSHISCILVHFKNWMKINFGPKYRRRKKKKKKIQIPRKEFMLFFFPLLNNNMSIFWINTSLAYVMFHFKFLMYVTFLWAVKFKCRFYY